jgi:hypothetical protein
MQDVCLRVRACDDAGVRSLRMLLVPIALLALASSASATAGAQVTSTSHAQLWSALGGQVTCGIAIHPPNSPPMELLCDSPSVPPPKHGGFGDPGFVFLGSVGHPSLARLSQDSFVGTRATRLQSGRSWAIGPIAVTCRVSAAAVRCTNRSHHGFTITKRSYRAF